MEVGEIRMLEWGRTVVVAAHAFNPSICEARSRQISEFQPSLIYRASSGTARAIETLRNFVSKKIADIKTPCPRV